MIYKLYDMISLLRNSVTVVGEHQDTVLYRERCVDLAFHLFCSEIYPQLQQSGDITSDEISKWNALTDLSFLHAKKNIVSQ